MGHPLRVRIIAALDDGPRALVALASELETDRRSLARHLRALEQVGVVTRDRLERATTYRLAKTPFFSDGEFGSLSQTPRTAAVAAGLARCHDAAASALEAGGFERADIHLSHTSLDLTERQWRALAGEFARLLERVEAAADEPDGPAQDRVEASAVLMLFERSGASGTDPEAHGDEPRSVEGGLEDAWAISEQVEQALSGPVPDWSTVIALADRLRVVGRSALAQEIGAAERAPTSA